MGTAGGENAALGSADNLANVVGASSLPAFVMLIVGILAMAGEYQHRTVTSTSSPPPDEAGCWSPNSSPSVPSGH